MLSLYEKNQADTDDVLDLKNQESQGAILYLKILLQCNIFVEYDYF